MGQYLSLNILHSLFGWSSAPIPPHFVANLLLFILDNKHRRVVDPARAGYDRVSPRHAPVHLR